MRENISLSAEIPAAYQGLRLDAALSRVFPQYSRTRLQQWIRNREVLVDGRVLRTRDIVSGGEQVEVRARLSEEGPLDAEEIDLDIVYEDPFCCRQQAPGLVVAPRCGYAAGQLANALLIHAQACPAFQGPVSCIGWTRIPRVAGGGPSTQIMCTGDPLQQRTVKRKYEVLVHGRVIAGGSVEAPIGRHPVDRKKMAVTPSGKPAITHYRVRKNFDTCTHLDVQLETGRTHQIRVHMAHLRFPVVGDPVYGKRTTGAGTVCRSRSRLARFHARPAMHAI